MKKPVAIVLVVVFLFSSYFIITHKDQPTNDTKSGVPTAGTNNPGYSDSQNKKQTTINNAAILKNNTASETTPGKLPPKGQKQGEIDQKAVGGNANPSKKSSSSEELIIKSDNQVLAGSKQQMVQQLDNELNTLVNTLNEMDTVDDTDLTIQ